MRTRRIAGKGYGAACDTARVAGTEGVPRQVLSSITLPVAVLVGLVIAAAWIVTWATSDLVMALMAVPMFPTAAVDLAVFFAVLVVMMIAMMLPSALPMILAFRGLTRLEYGRVVRPADTLGTALFVAPYFLVWGAFAAAALFALMGLGILGPPTGAVAFLPGAVLLAAGAWQATRTKEVCLSHCQSPMGFVMHHWRSGRAGAFRMGLRHSAYCIGCCWLFMLVLFVAGAMSLVWMTALSAVIFVEKVGVKPDLVPRVIGALLVGLGLLVALQAVYPV